MGCKSPDPNRPFGDLAGGRVCGANRRLKWPWTKMQNSGP